jgi:Uma2 family endonuclease
MTNIKKKRNSIKHSNVTTNVAGLFFNNEKLKPFVELTLDASQIDLSQFGLKTKDELVPEVCVYIEPPTKPPSPDDVLVVSKMPDLVIEVLSPKQRINELFAKFKAYFALGVKSCWLVIPSMDVINVYSQPYQHTTFDSKDTEVIDEVLDIRLPIQKIFEW